MSVIFETNQNFYNAIEENEAEYISDEERLRGEFDDWYGSFGYGKQIQNDQELPAWLRCIEIGGDLFALTPEQLSEKDAKREGLAENYLWSVILLTWSGRHPEVDRRAQFLEILHRVHQLPKENQFIGVKRSQQIIGALAVRTKLYIDRRHELLAEFLDHPYTPFYDANDPLFVGLLMKALRDGDAPAMAFFINRGLQLPGDKFKPLFNVFKNVIKLNNNEDSIASLECADQMMRTLNVDLATAEDKAKVEKALRLGLHLPAPPRHVVSYFPRIKTYASLISLTSFLRNHNISLFGLEISTTWALWAANSITARDEKKDPEAYVELKGDMEDCLSFLICNGAAANWEQDVKDLSLVYPCIEAGITDFSNRELFQTEEGFSLLQNNILSTDLNLFIVQFVYGKW